jgi:hypothetical protein
MPDPSAWINPIHMLCGDDDLFCRLLHCGNIRKTKIKLPFFVFNPKSYLYGEELLKLAKRADELAAKYPECSILVTVPLIRKMAT